MAKFMKKVMEVAQNVSRGVSTKNGSKKSLK